MILAIFGKIFVMIVTTSLLGGGTMAKLPDGWVFMPKPVNMTTIDIEKKELVMCRNCRHRDPEDHKCDHGWIHCIVPVDDDFWCAYGEKWTK